MTLPIAIVGAGAAGLACARRLTDQGRAVRVFDKGRKAGGRLATRRVETAHGPAQFDHGAQYFTARDPDFTAAVANWRANGPVIAWDGDFAVLTAGRSTPSRAEARYVAAPGMSALGAALAGDLPVACGVEIIRVRTDGAGHWLDRADARHDGPFSAVVIATPAEQAARLLDPIAPAFAAEALTARTGPCWAGLFAFAAPTFTPFTALRLSDHPVLGWIALDSAKPGRNENIVCWVAHARPDWSRANLERDAADVCAELQAALMALFDNRPEPIYAQAHRWRYAQVEQAAGSAFAWDAQSGIGACGDWRLGPRVELAWRSGFELAGAMLT
jgi:renalase